MRTHPMVIIGGILQENPFLFRRMNSCESYARAAPLKRCDTHQLPGD
jgi:hypothetical protein